jgi:hypothetical protein
MLPYIEQQPLFQKIDRSVAIPTYLEPGRGPRPPVEIVKDGGGAWTDYFLNNVLNNQTSAALNMKDNHTRLTSITDGSSNTILAGHGNVRTTQYALASGVAGSTHIFTGGVVGTARGGTGANGAGALLAQDKSTVNGAVQRWGGPFPQGGLMCMGDATVRLFNYRITAASFIGFLTPHGGESAALPDA